MALVREAQRRSERVVVSIFVNPTQFAPNEDFASYPRSFATDLKALRDAKVDFVWAPSVETMCRMASVRVWRRKARPRLVSRMSFGRISSAALQPWWPNYSPKFADFALFGQEDCQQLRVVTQMAKDLILPVKVIGVPTVREPDGLALSSRNVYLSATERAVAPMLYRVLNDCAARIKNGEKIDRVLNVGRIEFDLAGFEIDYLEHVTQLRSHPFPRQGWPNPAARRRPTCKTRLIDNVPV
jgi:pantoate--beta-alanine ligase